MSKSDWDLDLDSVYVKRVHGMMFNGTVACPNMLSVRLKYNDGFKTLSLSDDMSMQYTICLTDIEDKLREALDYDN